MTNRVDPSARARAVRWRFLRRTQRLGGIENLVRRPCIALVSRSGETVGTYTPDFGYSLPNREQMAEEVCVVATADARLREEHFEADYGVRVRIVMADQAARTPVEVF